MNLTRRDFMKKTGTSVALASTIGLTACANKPEDGLAALPTRKLGKTGLDVTTLTFGGGSMFLKNKDGDWEPILQRAIDMGITVFDTASSYQFGARLISEQRFGMMLPAVRDKVLISTKFDSRTPDDAMKEIEKSLTDLKTDYIDILMMHSVEKSEDLDAFGDTIYPMLMKLKEQGVARYIGFSSMNSAEKSKELIERYDVDACILALNATKYGSFAPISLPVAAEKNVGVFAMKVMRDVVNNGATPDELMNYVLGLDGVASACVGHFGMDTLNDNARIVQDSAATKSAQVDPQDIEQRLAHLAGPHVLSWARDDYYDGKMC
jgi:hypothetical protein